MNENKPMLGWSPQKPTKLDKNTSIIVCLVSYAHHKMNA